MLARVAAESGVPLVRWRLAVRVLCSAHCVGLRVDCVSISSCARSSLVWRTGSTELSRWSRALDVEETASADCQERSCWVADRWRLGHVTALSTKQVKGSRLWTSLVLGEQPCDSRRWIRLGPSKEAAAPNLPAQLWCPTRQVKAPDQHR